MPDKKDHRHAAVKKFLFDMHSFDKVDVVAPEDLPPVFSEADMAAARAEAHAAGKAEGLKDAARSREQQTANMLRVIAESFAGLFAAEDGRERVFEEESVLLAKTMLSTLFPAWNARLGQDEVRTAVLEILETCNRQSVITIELSPEDAGPVEQALQSHWHDPESAPRCRVLSHDALKTGQCRLSWADGGAVRDSGALAARIAATLESLLPPGRGADQHHTPPGQNDAIKEGDSLESTAADAPDATTTNAGEQP